MELRQIDIITHRSNSAVVKEAITHHDAIVVWNTDLGESLNATRLIAPKNKVEALTDEVAKALLGDDDYRVVVSAVEATMPAPAEFTPDENVPGEGAGKLPESMLSGSNRISREELYGDIEPGTRISAVYLLTAFLSALVAALGLMRDDVAVVIGAMVIAPLLKPNMALALSVTLGDTGLAKEAIKANAGGAAVVLLTAYVLGIFAHVDISSAQIATRTGIDLGDMALAAAAGTAGALAFTSGVPATLIGVMVAVALLPPLVCVGLLMAEHEFTLAAGALSLLIVNVTCVNLSAVGTFLVQGIRPMDWWESEKAKRATRMAILFWSIILVILVLVVFLEPRIGR